MDIEKQQYLKTLIDASLQDTDFNEMDVVWLIIKKRIANQRSISSVTWMGLAQLSDDIRTEMDAFRAKLREMNAQSELANRKALLEALLLS